MTRSVPRGKPEGSAKGIMSGRSQAEPGGAGPGVKRPGAAKAAGVGDERHADMEGALRGDPTDKNPLHGAIRELHSQHPHGYNDLGPHHGTTEHMRHEPLHGLRPTGD